MNTDSAYLLLSQIPEIGATSAMRLLKRFGSPEAIFSASKSELMSVERIGEKAASSILENSKSIDLKLTEKQMADVGAEYINISQSAYPKLLKTLPDSPVGLYKIGNADLNAPCVAIVGSRLCTVYGQSVARKFAASLARAGFTIVSGLARGIDTAAHIGALEAGGKTIAVLGCGVNVIYPPENAELYKKIIAQGAIVSEFPMFARADKQTFPIRNRVISGLSLAVIVVESDMRGGSMITARLAAEQGRDVFAVPGRIDSNASRGCHALIRDGVNLASAPEDIIESLSFSGQVSFSFDEEPTPQKKEKNLSAEIKLTKDESDILKAVQELKNPVPDTISAETKLPVSKCLASLLMLEIKKLIKKNPDGTWSSLYK